MTMNPVQEMSEIGPYRLEQVIGRGGLSRVYRAIDSRDGRVVALKLVDLREHGSGEARERTRLRLLAEADAMRRIVHPGVVRVEDCGTVDDAAFLTMELVRGHDLARGQSRGLQLDWSELAGIGAQVARALAEAHGLGIVHGDIKPANIMYDNQGAARVLDFGLATWVGGSRFSFAGTPAFLAPERLQGGVPLAPSDIYGLGATLFAVACGKAPFCGDSVAELLYKISHEEAPPVTAFRPDTPMAIAEAIARCLAKAPESRYSSAVALAEALEDWQGKHHKTRDDAP